MLALRDRSVVVALLSASSLSAAVFAQSAVPLGSELHVNLFTTNNQNMPALAMESNGDFVVTWVSYESHDGDGTGIFARRFDSLGAAQGGEIQVNSYTTGYQLAPGVAADADGDFIVVWQSFSQDNSAEGIFGQRFGSTGSRVGAEFQVNSFTSKPQRYPAVAMDGDGDFVVAWQSDDQEGGLDEGIFARRFSASGVAQAVELQVNTYTTANQERATVAANGAGAFVVAWQSYLQEGSSHGVFAQLFTSTGARIGSELQVNSYTPSHQRRPSAAMEDDGELVIAWQSFGQDEPGYGVRARRFDATANPIGDEIAVNQYGFDDQSLPRVEVSSGGQFVIAWQSDTQDGSTTGVFARRFTEHGVANGAEFQVNTYTTLSQDHPAIAARVDGDFVVAWESGQEGADPGIYAQRFATIATLDVDGNGVTTALTDGLLMLRFMFGFTGTTLTTGAVGPGCTRCDAAAIEAYLQPLV